MPAKSSNRGYKGPTKVVQPPRTVVRFTETGEQVHRDISGINVDDDAFFLEITADAEPWDIDRVAAECDRALATAQRWEKNYRDHQQGRTVRPDDRTFIAPHGVIGGIRWYRAGDVRAWFIENGLMLRTGVLRPYSPEGRRKGAPNKGKRVRKVETLVNREAPAVLARYRELVGAGMRDGEARDVIARERGLRRTNVNRRIKAAVAAEAASAGTGLDRDPARLLARYQELCATTYAAVPAKLDRHNRACEELCRQTGLSRRELGNVLKAAPGAGTILGQVGGPAPAPVPDPPADEILTWYQRLHAANLQAPVEAGRRRRAGKITVRQLSEKFGIPQRRMAALVVQARQQANTTGQTAAAA